ncbi:unnamed protein product [Bemisia tabaci]|uniref:APCDD1 domain-containing protein n=1 Tax=Bemisia tabaci TaxID=7038 RepID=A0A9P0EYE7_BEMTA|nr:unnamed protein product [Bemisia tabaci]
MLCWDGTRLQLSVIFLFLTSLFSTKGTYGDESGEKCEKLAAAITKNDKETRLEDVSSLSGKWVSERCEIRSGPEFLLRSYVFSKNDTFHITQYFYRDESCSTPLYALNAWGKIQFHGPSWVTPGATAGDFTLSRVAILAQNDRAAEDLWARFNSSCPSLGRRKWKPYKEYNILDEPEILSNSAPIHGFKFTDGYPRKKYIPSDSIGMSRQAAFSTTVEDSTCIQNLHPLFNELQLVRIQKRPPGPLNPRFFRQEMLLGDIRSRFENRSQNQPTVLHTPLIRVEQAQGCEVCRAIIRATERTFPQLNAQPRLPIYLGGEWVSGHCETRPLGTFLKRRLQVIANTSTWQVDYRFYSDMACSAPTLTATASGYFSTGLPSMAVQGGTEFDFHVQKAYIMLFDEGLVHTLQNDPRCGTPGTWRTGVMHDLAPSNGCVTVGIVVPTTVYELVRLEINSNGMPLLFMGQPDPDDAPVSVRLRPTSYQPPLIQCASQLPPYTHFITARSSSSRRQITCALVFFQLIYVICNV